MPWPTYDNTARGNLYHQYAFGDYLLDPAERLLLRSGEPVQLTPRVFELLLTLVERQGRVVEKEQLMQLLWPDEYVEESNLKQSVSVLRKALGDSRARPKYIETIPKLGYRFIAGVYETDGREYAELAMDAIDAMTAGGTRLEDKPGGRRRAMWLSLMLLCLLGAGLSLAFYSARKPAPTRHRSNK